MNKQIVNQKHINDFGFACVNGYKGNIYEYLQNKYKSYCDICKRCEIEPMFYEDWLVTAN